jgi:two-component system OmpR family sensor kinase
VTRLPIRLRLTVVFVAVMSVVLLVIGLFLFYRTRSDLDAAINQALRAREGNLRASAAAAPTGRGPAIPPGENDAQLLTIDGRILASRPNEPPLLTPAETRRAAQGLRFVEHEHERLIAGPTRVGGRPAVAVAASALADRERALEGLGRALLVGGPLALLLAAGIGYATAAAALTPVEDMRRRAEGISRADLGAQVPVSPANDEIRRLGLTLNRMLARLGAAAEHERSFVANASHELRTPLATLLAELDLALRHGSSADELRASIRAAMADGHRLSALADDLLDLARADEPVELLRDTVDLDALLAGVAENLRPTPQAEGRTIVAEPSGLMVLGDEAGIERAVRNMADNALIHGRGTVTLGADLAPEAFGARIWVRDEGTLDATLVPRRAFERFVRGADATGRPGAGLGLSLVQAVAERHGGDATLERRPAGGVQAALTLPDALP